MHLERGVRTRYSATPELPRTPWHPTRDRGSVIPMHHSIEAPPRITLRAAIIEYLANYDRTDGFVDPQTLIAITRDLATEDDRPIAEAARKSERALRGFNSPDEIRAAREEMRKALTAKQPSKLVRAVQDYITAYETRVGQAAYDALCEASRRRDAALAGRTDAFANAIRSTRYATDDEQRHILSLWVDADGNERAAPLTLAQAVQEYLTAVDPDAGGARVGPLLGTSYAVARGVGMPLALAVRRFEAATGGGILPPLAAVREALAAETADRLPLAKAVRDWISAPAGEPSIAAASRVHEALEGRSDPFAL